MTSKSIFALAYFMALLHFSNTHTLMAQTSNSHALDSLLIELTKAKLDTNKIKLLNDISWEYKTIDPKKGIEYGEQGFALAHDIGWKKGKALTMNQIGINNYYQGAYLEAIPQLLQAIDLSQQTQLTSTMGLGAIILGLCYENTDQAELALQAYIQSSQAFRKIDHPYLKTALNNTCIMYLKLLRYPEALSVTTELYEYSKERNDDIGLGHAYRFKGAIYAELSNYPIALQNFFNALKIFEKHNLKSLTNTMYTSIGTIYETQGAYEKSLDYYNKALTISEEMGTRETSALLLSNIGSVYDLQKDYIKARSYYQQAYNIYQEFENHKDLALITYNMGGVYLVEKDHENALLWLEKAIKESQRLQDNFQTGVILGLTGETYHQIAVNNDSKMLDKYFSGNKDAAIKTGLKYTDSAITILTNQGELKNRGFYLNQKSKIQAILNQYEDALISYKQYAEINDSLFNIARDKKLVQAEMGYEYGRREDSLNLVSTKQKLELQNKIELQSLAFEYETKQAAAQSELEKKELAYEEALKRQAIENEYVRKQAQIEALHQKRELEQKQKEALNIAELKRQRNIRNSTLLGASGLLLFSMVVMRQRNKVKKEKARSEALLLNILPAEIAEELKEKGKAAARDFDMVSILFSDFIGFTEFSAKLSAADLVSEINHCFEAFDGMMLKHHVEKIKTIGDAYMAAGGLPVPAQESVRNTVLAALDMQSFIGKRKANMDAQGLPAFNMRVGIHTGPIVAGIVGVNKFQYDIWGDAVNTASRMESAGEVGKVNISQQTYELIKNDPDFVFECRGKISAKGKGEIDMWFVSKKNT